MGDTVEFGVGGDADGAVEVEICDSSSLSPILFSSGLSSMLLHSSVIHMPL